MRYALVLTAAALIAPSAVRAADPPITFQTHPVERVLNDMRFAADLVGGEKAVKAFNDGIKDRLGEKGFEGLDLGKPVVGYINLMPKPDDTSVVVAFPVTGEKEFIALCDRWNRGEKAKEVAKGIWQLPPLAPRYKARMKFSGGYAYIASGDTEKAALAALDDKALVAPNKIYDPAENAVFMGKVHFDRLTPEFKRALPTYAANFKRELGLDGGGIDRDLSALMKAAMPDIEKMFTRFLLLLGGADTATLRVNVDLPTSDLVVEFALNPKANTPLAKAVGDFKPTGNRFAGLLTPDTVAGFKTRLPFFNDELKAAGVKMLEEGQKKAGGPGAPKDMLDELFKGLIRTVKTGEADIVAGVRGPDKNGDFALVAAIAFEDPAALEKEFKKAVEKDAPQDELDRFKWNAATADKVNIHTYKLPNDGFLNPAKGFGAEKSTIAFAFAPKGIFIVMGADPVPVMKDALAVKPTDAPMLDVVLNPARMGKLVAKFGGNQLEVENALGKEDKLVSALSLRVEGGKDLKVRLAVNLRILPRAIFTEGGAAEPPQPIPPPPPAVQRR